MVRNKQVQVEVVYASTQQQCLMSLEVEAGSTVLDVIMLSKITEQFPEIDLTTQKVGIFSQVKSLHDKVQAGDRIEIYRELIIDPKDARRRREQARK